MKIIVSECQVKITLASSDINLTLLLKVNAGLCKLAERMGVELYTTHAYLIAIVVHSPALFN